MLRRRVDRCPGVLTSIKDAGSSSLKVSEAPTVYSLTFSSAKATFIMVIFLASCDCFCDQMDTESADFVTFAVRALEKPVSGLSREVAPGVSLVRAVLASQVLAYACNDCWNTELRKKCRSAQNAVYRVLASVKRVFTS